MNLKKMDPMARKLAVHSEQFAKALENGNAVDAQAHINEVLKFAGFLSDDLHTAVVKAERETVDLQFNMISKMNVSGQKFDVKQRNDVLPGTVIAARTQRGMTPHRGTFGRFVPDQ
jgi:hypothetical protein